MKMDNKVLFEEALKITNLEILNKVFKKLDMERLTMHQYETMIEYHYKSLTGG